MNRKVCLFSKAWSPTPRRCDIIGGVFSHLFKNFDFSIPLIILAIGILGLSLLFSLAPGSVFPQLIFFILGFVLFLIFSQIDFRIYQNLRWFFYGGSLILLFVTFLFGEITRGSVRWIQVGQLTIQTSEMVKPFLITFFAFFFADQPVKLPKLLWGIFLFLIPAFLIFKQPDLGSTLVITAALLGILLASGITFRVIFTGLLGLAAALPVSWFLLVSYQKERILSFFNPYDDPLGSGYNLIQAMISVGSGQVFGRGLGKGTQSQLAFLPERHTDFIFAAFSEELGFVGVLILLSLYFFLLWRILKVAQKANQDFARLFCLGIFIMLLFQIFVNIGMNLGLVPITGITLPFLSYGGSSILAMMICLGMIESIARFQKRQEAIEIK